MGGKTGRIFEDLLLENILTRVGLSPDDLTHADVANQPDALNKLDRSEIACALFTPPWLFEATKRGHNVLLDPFELMLDFQLGGIVATRSLIAAEPELVRRTVKAYVDGIHHYKRHPGDVVKVLEKYSKIADRATALQCHALYDKFFVPKPYPSVKGLKTVLDQMARYLPEAEGVDPERFIDRSFLEELDRGGYIDELYARDATP
jgi:ABC-type nitrate/sulfonate/bicarbonate transport system substrate-binding protein